MRFQRCRDLFGEDGLRRVKDIKVIILGLELGSYILDCLYRSGVSDITIVDYDKFDETNRNRQIGSDRLEI